MKTPEEIAKEIVDNTVGDGAEHPSNRHLVNEIAWAIQSERDIRGRLPSLAEFTKAWHSHFNVTRAHHDAQWVYDWFVANTQASSECTHKFCPDCLAKIMNGAK